MPCLKNKPVPKPRRERGYAEPAKRKSPRHLESVAG